MKENVENNLLRRNLTALIEFSRIVNSSMNLEFTLNNLLLSTLGKFLTTKGLVALYQDDKLVVRASKGISEPELQKFPSLTTSSNINGEVAKFIKENNLAFSEEIVSSRAKLGLIILGQKITKSDYSTEEKDFLKTILNLASTAIDNFHFITELKSVNVNLDTRINRLTSLFELSKEFGLLNEESRIAKLLVYSLLGHFLVSNYAIIYSDENKFSALEATGSKATLNEAIQKIEIAKISSALCKNELEELSADLSKMNYELGVPMRMRNETKGLILLGKRMNNIPFVESDLEFIYSLGSLGLVSLENRKLFREALEKQKLEEELELAREIQKNLFPRKIPSTKNFEIAAESISSKQVGGDYYDLIKNEFGNYVVAIGDVSGKGVPASLLMANLQAFLKSICKQEVKIDSATGLLNDLVYENTTDGRFITFFWMILDDAGKKINYVNAGHNPPLLIRNDKVIHLNKGGIILGVVTTMMPYVSEEVFLESGDVIVLFTDGVTEAKNKLDEEFGDEKFEKLLVDNRTLSAKDLLTKIKKNIEIFSGGEPQSDDITLVVIKAL